MPKEPEELNPEENNGFPEEIPSWEEMAAAPEATQEFSGPSIQKKAAKYKTEDYISFFETKGWVFKLNLLNDFILFSDGIEELHYLKDPDLKNIERQLLDDLPRSQVELKQAERCIYYAAGLNKIHPIKDYLEKITWDEVPRIKKFCTFFESSKKLFPLWFEKWIVGAIARVYGEYQNPMLVLDGPQGMGKTKVTEYLCSFNKKLYLSSSIFPDLKDCRLRLTDVFIWEVPELGNTTRRADVSALKGFLTLREVRDRRPYGKMDVIFPAVSSFIGTINGGASGFLLDRTGNRRFLVTELTKINWDYINFPLDQLWAEAFYIYKVNSEIGKEPWRLNSEEEQIRSLQNENFLIQDPVEEILNPVLIFTGKDKNFVSTQILIEFLRNAGVSINRGMTKSIAQYILRNGGESFRKKIQGKKIRGYSGVKLEGVTIQNGHIVS